VALSGRHRVEIKVPGTNSAEGLFEREFEGFERVVDG
jgi:hypothetical protein